MRAAHFHDGVQHMCSPQRHTCLHPCSDVIVSGLSRSMLRPVTQPIQQQVGLAMTWTAAGVSITVITSTTLFTAATLFNGMDRSCCISKRALRNSP